MRLIQFWTLTLIIFNCAPLDGDQIILKKNYTYIRQGNANTGSIKPGFKKDLDNKVPSQSDSSTDKTDENDAKSRDGYETGSKNPSQINNQDSKSDTGPSNNRPGNQYNSVENPQSSGNDGKNNNGYQNPTWSNGVSKQQNKPNRRTITSRKRFALATTSTTTTTTTTTTEAPSTTTEVSSTTTVATTTTESTTTEQSTTLSTTETITESLPPTTTSITTESTEPTTILTTPTTSIPTTMNPLGCIPFPKDLREKQIKEMVTQIRAEIDHFCLTSEETNCKTAIKAKEVRSCISLNENFAADAKRKGLLREQDAAIKPIPKMDRKMGSRTSKRPLKVDVVINITAISSISEIDMDFRVDFDIHQNWTAARKFCLQYAKSICIAKNLSLLINETYRFGMADFSLFWTPDTFIMNAKTSEMPSEIIKTQKIRIKPLDKGTCGLTLSKKITTTLSCPMNFQMYTTDIQNCKMKLRSFSYASDDIEYFIDDSRLNFKDITLLEHNLGRGFNLTKESILNETYWIIEVKFILQRQIPDSLIGVYTPSIICVVASFTTFFLGLESTSDRVVLGILVILALVNMFTGSRKELPPCDYVNKLDQWMVTCIFFVTAQLIEATLVDYYYERRVLESEKAENERKLTENLVLQIIRGDFKCKEKELQMMKRRMKPKSTNKSPLWKFKFLGDPFARGFRWLYWHLIHRPNEWLFGVNAEADLPEYMSLKIDAYSRIFFPIIFSIFFLSYWSTILMYINENVQKNDRTM